MSTCEEEVLRDEAEYEMVRDWPPEWLDDSMRGEEVAKELSLDPGHVSRLKTSGALITFGDGKESRFHPKQVKREAMLRRRIESHVAEIEDLKSEIDLLKRHVSELQRQNGTLRERREYPTRR